MRDDLGNRMKENYEDRTRYFLPRRSFTIIRLDGKSFHTYTRGLDKPFDEGLFEDMDNAIIAMLPQIQGAQFAYTQSDEISVLVTDFEKPTTCAWFDGNIQKMVSVSASIITGEFNRLRARRWRIAKTLEKSTDFLSYHMSETDDMEIEPVSPFKMAYFDSRVFTIPDRTEVMNYFIWRNQDCARNSVSMVAQSLFSHKELQSKSTAEMQEMMFKQHGINWANYDPSKKNGRLIVKQICTESNWVSIPAWKFTEDKDKLLNLIPNYV